MSWCPPFGDYITRTYSAETCRFLSGLPRSQESIHINCTHEQCFGNIRESECETRHVTQGCDCGDVITPPMGRIKELIRNKRIPLLSFGDDLKIKVVEAKFDSRYIAVSHVWTGGLGNPRANALPKCQLLRIDKAGKQVSQVIEETSPPSFITLFRKLRSIFRSQEISLFWIDTLCIPVKEWTENEQGVRSETETSWKMRAMAIDRMTQIYAGAHSVLILDPVLLSLSNDMLKTAAERVKFFGYVVLSDWMRRCWTYQEGAMGGRLFALLKAGPVYLTWERFMVSRSRRNQPSQLERDLTKWLELPTPPRAQSGNAERPIIGIEPRIFAEVWNNLMSRTTTHTRDRYLILALMLNLVPGELVNSCYNDTERMRIIFNSLHRIPLDLVYKRGGSPGSYWLPVEMGESIAVSGSTQLVRTNFEEDYLTLKHQASTTARLDMPGLYILPRDRLGRSRGHFRITDGLPERYARIVNFSMAHSWSRYPSFALLLEDIRGPAVRPNEDYRTRAVLFGVADSDETKTTIERLCGWDCAIQQYASMPQSDVRLNDDQLCVSGKTFRIRCHFGQDTKRLDIHRDPSLPLNPGRTVTVPVHMHLEAHLGVFLTLYCILAGVIGCTPNKVSFHPAWMLVITWTAFWPMVFSLYHSLISDSRRGERAMHATWLNSLTPAMPDALPHSLKVLKRVNYGLFQTLFRIALGLSFTTLGIVYRDNRDCRVMTVLGIMWLLELALRWLLELTYNHYWKVNTMDLHPLAKEFLHESRLTRWCKRWFGWPKSTVSDAPSQSQQGIPYYLDY